MWTPAPHPFSIDTMNIVRDRPQQLCEQQLCDVAMSKI